MSGDLIVYMIYAAGPAAGGRRVELAKLSFAKPDAAQVRGGGAGGE